MSESITFKICINDNNDNLWCMDCKNKIDIGDKYILVLDGEKIDTTYHIDCWFAMQQETYDYYKDYIQDFGDLN